MEKKICIWMQLTQETDELHEAFPEFEIRMDPLSLSVACHIGPGARAVTLTKILHVN